MSRKKRIIGALLAAAGGMSWGLSGSVGQYLFTVQNMDSKWLVPIRLGLAGILLMGICIARYGGRVLEPWKDPEERKELFLYGLVGVSFCQFFYFLTIQLSTAGVATILQDLAPVFILIYSCVRGKRRPARLEIGSILLALIGVVLISTHGSLNTLSVSPQALISGVICAVCVMVYNVAPVHLMDKYPVALLQSWAFLMGGVMFTIVFRPFSYHYVPTAAGWAGIAFVVIIGNIVAFCTYLAGVHLIGPSKAVLYGFAEPVTAAVVAVLYFGNSFTFWDGVGFVCIFLMLAMISSSQK